MDFGQRKLVYLGGSFAPNCLMIDYDDERIIVDCGIEILPKRKGKPSYKLPDFTVLNDGKKITAVLITHMNIDHSAGIAGLAPYLSEEAKILAPTQTIMALPDILQEQMELSSQEGFPAFNKFQIAKVNSRRYIIEGPGLFKPSQNSKIEIYANSAGHMPGAAYYIFYLPDGTKGMVTGDMSFHPQPIENGAKLLSTVLPKEMLPNEIWSNDETYPGGLEENNGFKTTDSSEHYKSEMERLHNDCKKTLENGRWVVLLALSMGRAQNLAVYLAEKGLTPYLDGASRKYLDLFSKYKWSENDINFSTEGIIKIENTEMREKLISSKTPGVYITTSGMGDFGPAPEYLRKTIPQEGCLIGVANWAPQESLISRLLRAAQAKKESFFLNGEHSILLPLNADVIKYACTGHCSGADNIIFIEDMVMAGEQPENRIILDHGEDRTKSLMAKKLREKKLARDILMSHQNMTINLDYKPEYYIQN